jgi:hypothetical protein
MPKPTPRLFTSALKLVPLRVGHLHRSVKRFQPLLLSTPKGGRPDYVAGESMWGLLEADEPVALCWDWACWQWDETWVVTLANAMTIESNVLLLDDFSKPMKPSLALLEINRAVHDLPWQEWVMAQVRHQGKIPGHKAPVRRSRRDGQAALGLAYPA